MLSKSLDDVTFDVAKHWFAWIWITFTAGLLSWILIQYAFGGWRDDGRMVLKWFTKMLLPTAGLMVAGLVEGARTTTKGVKETSMSLFLMGLTLELVYLLWVLIVFLALTFGDSAGPMRFGEELLGSLQGVLILVLHLFFQKGTAPAEA